MRAARIRRLLHGSRACPVQTCPHARQRVGMSVWCRDHTLSIFAGSDMLAEGYRVEAARELGPRRWHLHAEVVAEQERKAAEVLAAILEMTPEERSYPSNRYCWDMGAVKLSGRVDELLALSEQPGGRRRLTGNASTAYSRTVPTQELQPIQVAATPSSEGCVVGVEREGEA